MSSEWTKMIILPLLQIPCFKWESTHTHTHTSLLCFTLTLRCQTTIVIMV